MLQLLSFELSVAIGLRHLHAMAVYGSMVLSGLWNRNEDGST